MSVGKPFQQHIYYKSPPFLKNLISSFYGLIQKRERYKKQYKKSFDFLQESQWFSNGKLRELQFEETRNFLIHAATHTGYYRKLFKDADFDPQTFKSLDEVSHLPILRKSTIREKINYFLADNYSRRNVLWAHTSGTTGQALSFPLSSECFQREHAFRHIHYSWGGVSDGDKIAVCAGHPVTFISRSRPPFWTYDYINNWLILSSYHLNESNLLSYIDELAKFQPDMLKGYPSSVYLLALANKKWGQKVKTKAVYTASETLLDFQRKAIESYFGCKVFNWYGTSEMCVNIVECDHGSMHLKQEHSYIELLDLNNKPVKPGEEGRIVCTAFGNYALPFIRYDLGDIAIKSQESKCSCRRGGEVIDKIVGRKEDYIITPDGRFIGRLDHLFKDSINIIEAQIIQNEFGRIIIRAVINKNYNAADESAVLKEARERLGKEVKIDFEYVEAIPRTKSGKFRFIVSNVDKQKIFDNLI